MVLLLITYNSAIALSQTNYVGEINDTNNFDIIINSSIINNTYNSYIISSQVNIVESINDSNNLDLINSSTINNNITLSDNYIDKINRLNDVISLLLKSDNVSNEKIYEEIINNLNSIIEYLNEVEREIIFNGKNNESFFITKVENIKNVNNKNYSNQVSVRIDFNECENLLREENNINNNNSLIILLSEKESNISSQNNIQFEIYDSLYKNKLNLSQCKDIPINIHIPSLLTKEINNLYNELDKLGYNLFDINDKFYQDVCTTYTSSNNTDVILSDRVEYYFINNFATQCQPGCKFLNYSLENQNIICECNISSIEMNNGNNKNNKYEDSKSLYKSFYEVLKYSNYKVLKCYKLAFTLNNLKKNIGTIMSMVYFSIYSTFLIINVIKGYSQIKNSISNLLNDRIQKGVKNLCNINTPIIINKEKEKSNNINISKNLENTLNNFSKKTIKKIDIKNNDHSKEFLFRKNRNKKRKRKGKNKIIFEFPPKKALNKKRNPKISKKMSNRSNMIFNSKQSIKDINKHSLDIFLTENKEKYDDFELNNMDYKDALKSDKRRFLNIYWSLLKREHIIIFSFFIRNDYNIVFVKFSRLIFLACSDMALNVFFFSDETMHKLFLDYGKYNFIQQIPQILYSMIVSNIIDVILCFLSLTDKYYYEIKRKKIVQKHDIVKILKFVRLKIIFFYVYTFILFLFFGYTITCFCSVYQNTQNSFIKDSILSLILGYLYPFVLYLFPAILRMISLKYCNGKLSFIYGVSDIIPIF